MSTMLLTGALRGLPFGTSILITSCSDCVYRNIMMDASTLYPSGFHPIYKGFLPDVSGLAPHLPRGSAPVTYYLIDFGISTRFSPDDPSKLVLGTNGIEDSVPELSKTVPYDPFKTDVYIIGALFCQEFLAVRTPDLSRVHCIHCRPIEILERGDDRTAGCLDDCLGSGRPP